MKKTKKISTAQPSDIALLTIVVLFHFLVLFTPLFFTFNTSELFEFNKMVLVYALTILIGGAWLTRMILHKQLLFKRTYLDIPIALFVGSQILSTIFSIHPQTSLLGYYSRFHGGLLSTFCYVLLYYAFATNIQKKHLPAFFLSLFFSGVIVSFYGILEHFGHSFSCFMVEGGKSFGVDCWIQDVKNRVFASFGQPNWLAAYLIMLVPVGISLALKEKQKKFVSYFYAVSSGIFFLTLLYTRSRSGFYGLLLGLLVYGVLFIIAFQGWKIQKLTSFITAKVSILGIIFALFVAILIFNSTPASRSLIELVSPPPAEPTQQDMPAPVVNRLDLGGTDSGEIRKIVWQGAVDVWKRYPVFGSGVETFAYSYYLDRPMEHNLVSEWDFLYNKAHNEFLNYLATTGAIGLLTYILLLGWFGLISFRQLTKTEVHNDQKLLLIGSISGVAALSVSNFFGFSTVMVTVLMYMYFAITSIQTDRSLELKMLPKKMAETSYLFFSIVTMLCVFLLNMTYQYHRADVAYAKGKAYLDAGYFQEGMTQLQTAIKKNPGEALFYDELATQYSRYAVGAVQEENLQDAQTLMLGSLQASEAVIALNPQQLNFYKTRAGVFITLAQVQPAFLEKAEEVLRQGMEKAPTDAKLVYNLGIVQISQGKNDEGIASLEKAVTMKPNYEAARLHLADAYEAAGKKDAALSELKYIVEKIAPQNQVALDKIATLSAERAIEE